MTTKKIALVTGGTSGIGLSLVKGLVENNFYVYFIGTNKEKGAAVEAELNAPNSAVCQFIELDLSNLNRVKEFVDQFKSNVSQLDILLNVAGVMLPNRQETPEGVEKTFAIGYLSSFILSTELVPLLEKVSHSRIINIGVPPAMALKRRLDFEDFNFNNNYSGPNVLTNTVHAKTVLTEILAEKLKDKKIDVISFNPGPVKSDIGRNMSFPLKPIFQTVSLFFPRESKSGIYLSTSDELKGVTGQFFSKEKPIPLNFEKAYKDQLWSRTEDVLRQVLYQPA